MTRTPDSKEAAARVRAVRAYRDLKQEELAQRLGISLATIRRIENGERPMSTEDLIRVAEVLDIPSAFMLQGFDAFGPEPNFDAITREIEDLKRRMQRAESRQDATDEKFTVG